MIAPEDRGGLLEAIIFNKEIPNWLVGPLFFSLPKE